MAAESVHGAILSGLPFRDAIADNDMARLENLLRFPADPTLGLEWAAAYAHDEAMKLLLNAPADPNSEPFHYFDHSDNAWSTTALHIAIMEADYDDDLERHSAATVVERLCAAGASVDAVDAEGDTPITVATRWGNVEAVRLLCAARANVDFAAPQGDENCGNTALQKAVWKGDADMVRLLLEMRADLDLEDDDGFTALGGATWVASTEPNANARLSGMVCSLLAARADVDAGRTTPLALAMECDDYEHAQLLLQAGASKARALAGRITANEPANIFFIGHQNTEAQRRAVDVLIGAHNAVAESSWSSWYAPRSLSTAQRVVQPPELAPARPSFYSWRGPVDHCTHGVLCSNSGRAARETAYDFLRNYSREHGLGLTIEHLDQEMLACMRLLPSEPEQVYRTLLCLRAFRGGVLPSTVCTWVAQFVA